MTTIETPERHLMPIQLPRLPASRMCAAERSRQRESSILLPKNGATATIREPLRANPRLAIYVRLSMASDTSVSIARQQETLEEYIVALGGRYDPSRDFFQDYDLSAKGTVYRPAAEQLLTRIRDEEYDGIVVWEFARFMRSVRESHIASALMRDHATELYSFEERALTLYGPARLMLEFAAEQAEKELQRISSRTKGAWAIMAAHGHHRAAAPFGLRKFEVPSTIPGRTAPLHHLTPDDEPRDYLNDRTPAELMREAAARVVAGDSLRSIARSWNEGGLRTITGVLWSTSVLTGLLHDPQLAGLATFHKKVLLDESGKPWRLHEPLLGEAVWEDLQAELANRSTGRRRSTNETLLRGLVRCGICGHSMVKGGTNYVCARKSQTGTGCTGNATAGRPTEAFAIEAALAVLADPRLLAAEHDSAALVSLTKQAEHEEAISRLRTALERLDRQRALGEYDDADGERRYAKLKAEFVHGLADLETRTPRRTRRTAPVLEAAEGESLAEAFDALPRARQTTVLGHVIDHIEVLAFTGKRGDRWSSKRINIVWRGPDA